MNPIHEAEAMDEAHDSPAALLGRLRARCARMSRSLDDETRKVSAALQLILDEEDRSRVRPIPAREWRLSVGGKRRQVA